MTFASKLWRCICLVFTLASAAAANTNHHVMLITIDGCAAFYLTDPSAPLPTLRKLAAQGASAEGMVVRNPSITWPNHTTLITGVGPDKHSVFFNGVLTRPGPGLGVFVDPKRDKADLVAVPTLCDALHQAGYRTAGINWPCTRNSGTLDDDFPDVPDSVTHSTPKLREELIAAGLLKNAADSNFTAQSAASRDQIWSAAALHVLRARRPNFLLWHMLVTDGLQHKYGPRSPAAYAALAQADAHLADFIRTLDEVGLRERSTIFIVSDHGFALSTNIIHPNVLFRKAGLLDTNGMTARLPSFKARAQIISEGGTALVYLTNPETKQADRAKVLELLRAQEGIAEIFEPPQFAALGFPLPEKNAQMCDLVLSAKPGWAFSNQATGEDAWTPVTLTAGGLGNHGYLASNPAMNALFVATGRGIKRGVKLGVIDNRDVAPTCAHLLGQKLSGADGKVLTEILD